MTSTTSIGTGGRLANRIRTGAATNHRHIVTRNIPIDIIGMSTDRPPRLRVHAGRVDGLSLSSKSGDSQLPMHSAPSGVSQAVLILAKSPLRHRRPVRRPRPKRDDDARAGEGHEEAPLFEGVAARRAGRPAARPCRRRHAPGPPRRPRARSASLPRISRGNSTGSRAP